MTDSITPDRIVDVAVDLLAVGGLHALAMRRISTELGIQQSALYWHFDNKQQLLGAVADRIVAPISGPSGERGSARLNALASGLRDALLRYPDGAELAATAFAFGLGAQKPYDNFVDELVGGGVSRDEAEIAASVLVHFVYGYTTHEQQRRQAAALGAIRQNDDQAAGDDDRFQRGIGLIVSGIPTGPSQ